jgi:putative colanic acid biosynthesis acetyltransferase WcaF
MPLVTKPIRIGAWAWVAADAFVGPGITVEEGAVVGARACVVHDVSAWTVVAGNPARVIKRRLPEGAALDSNRAKPLKVSSTIGPV